jgi:hypothetical protein
MNADKLANAPGGRSSGIRCGFYRGDIAANDGRHKTGADLLIADELNVRGLYHCVGCLDHRDEAFALDHS